jgi:hypothetical protein
MRTHEMKMTEEQMLASLPQDQNRDEGTNVDDLNPAGSHNTHTKAMSNAEQLEGTI